MIDLYAHLNEPVIIETIDVLRTKRGEFVRTRSTDGATGLMRANKRLLLMLPLLKELVIPFFVGKDARNLPELVEQIYVYRNNYKYTGLILWNSVSHVELSILDLLGQIAGKPVHALLGSVLRTEIPVYISSLTRETTPEEEVEWLAQRLRESGAQAVKLKIGGRMSNNADAMPGRTERLIPLARRTFGDDITIYVDANSSYDATTAIEVGRMLEDHGVAFFEEPCPFDDYEATQQVADALTMPVAGGEQESSLPRFRSMIRNRGVDVVQPDILYNGGLIRCLQVAQWAAEVNMPCTPHSPNSDSNAAYMLHFAAVVENSGPYQEYHGTPRPTPSWYAPPLDVRHGVVSVPQGAGLGISYDPSIFENGEKV
ncbi:MAG: mandelate racemase [Anaerolineaceae bacterium]|nr:mandelate racemase [Anaerolineaceae bacterium]